MKFRLYWRTLSPWIAIPILMVVTPILLLYAIVRNPRHCMRAWRASKRIY